MRSTLRQEGRSFEFPVCRNASYLAAMTPNLRGMVLTFSLWGSSEAGMAWLDGMTGCVGGCDVREQHVTWRDIQLHSVARGQA